MKCQWCGGAKNVKNRKEGLYHTGCLQAKRIVEDAPIKRGRGRPRKDGSTEPATYKKYYEPTPKVDKVWHSRAKESMERIIAKGTNRK